MMWHRVKNKQDGTLRTEGTLFNLCYKEILHIANSRGSNVCAVERFHLVYFS